MKEPMLLRRRTIKAQKMFFALKAILSHVFGSSPPYGKLNFALVNSPLSLLLVLWLFLYIGLAILFALGYWALGIHPTSGDGKPGFWVSLYFSFITQATIGYGDFAPNPRSMAVTVLQSCVGLVFNTLGFGIVIFGLLKNPVKIQFPDNLVYDPVRHNFWFRYISLDEDDLIDTKFTFLIKFPPPPNDTTYDIAWRLIEMDTDKRDVVPSMHLVGIRSLSNHGNRDHRPYRIFSQIILSPLDIVAGSVVDISIVGTRKSTGERVAALKSFLEEDIQCGAFHEGDNWEHVKAPRTDLPDRSELARTKDWSPLGDKRKRYLRLNRQLNQVISSSSDQCSVCPFFAQGCSLDIAQSTRHHSRAEQRS